MHICTCSKPSCVDEDPQLEDNPAYISGIANATSGRKDQDQVAVEEIYEVQYL